MRVKRFGNGQRPVWGHPQIQTKQPKERKTEETTAPLQPFSTSARPSSVPWTSDALATRAGVRLTAD